MKRNFAILILLIGLILLCSKAEAPISITVTGSWSETINASDLQAGAGSDLISTYESAADAGSIDITETSGNWAVDVKKVDTNWHSNLHLHIKRTSDGSGPGNIPSGGGTYQVVTDIDQSFFSGDGDRSSVNVQLKLTGISIQVAPDTYTATVYYTVYDQ